MCIVVFFSASKMASNIREHPIFLGSLEFETEGSPLSLTFWQGDKTYLFLTNFIGVYPIVPLGLSIEKKKTSNPIAAKQQSIEEGRGTTPLLFPGMS